MQISIAGTKNEILFPISSIDLFWLFKIIDKNMENLRAEKNYLFFEYHSRNKGKLLLSALQIIYYP